MHDSFGHDPLICRPGFTTFAMRTHVFRWSFVSICAADLTSLEDWGRSDNVSYAVVVCAAECDVFCANDEETKRPLHPTWSHISRWSPVSVYADDFGRTSLSDRECHDGWPIASAACSSERGASSNNDVETTKPSYDVKGDAGVCYAQPYAQHERVTRQLVTRALPEHLTPMDRQWSRTSQHHVDHRTTHGNLNKHATTEYYSLLLADTAYATSQQWPEGPSNSNTSASVTTTTDDLGQTTFSIVASQRFCS